MAGTYAVFSIDFFVMRWLKTRIMNRNVAVTRAGSEEGDPMSDAEKREKSLGDLGHSHGPAPDAMTDYASPQAHFDVLILEGGIIFHSCVRVPVECCFGSQR